MLRRRGRQDAGGSLLPGYSQLTEIGGGAFATVYRAVEIETGRQVALKILKVDTIHAQLIETFHREIHALAAVSDHPNIVTLYRPSTTTDGRPALVLELCRESLSAQMRSRGPLGPEETARVGIKIAGALETAHRNGFLHRDMKPQNILTTQFGEPALADFGVAALQASAQAIAGVFGFTTLHAAPEMLEGHHLSPATDIYGLASTMYQLLTGQAPFATYENEAPASVILRILRDPVRPLRGDNIPIELADLLEAALSKEPDGRPRSALDFARALQAVEARQGWLETTYVAWGEEGRPIDAEGLPERGPMGVATLARNPARSLGSRPPLISSPGIVTPQIVTPSFEPPLRPEGGLPSAAIPAAAGPPPVPPAPAGPVRPSIVAPEPGRRQIVSPVEARRGVPVLPVAERPVPLAPIPPAAPTSPPGSVAPVAPPPAGPAVGLPPPVSAPPPPPPPRPRQASSEGPDAPPPPNGQS